MNNLGCAIEKYHRQEVSCPEDVDKITSDLIRDIYGSLNEEMKSLRRAMMCMWIISNPRDFTPETVSASREEGNRLLTLNAKIEVLINEGRAFKKEQGWQS